VREVNEGKERERESERERYSDCVCIQREMRVSGKERKRTEGVSGRERGEREIKPNVINRTIQFVAGQSHNS